MFKKTSFVLGLLLLAGGCTREVYLQPVPCVDCEPCEEAPCDDLTPECCPELAMQTKTLLFEVYDGAAQTPCVTEEEKPRCRTVCRQRMVAQPVAQ